MWKVATNGTPTRIDLGSGSSSPNYLTNVNGTLYFTATGYNGTTYVGNELWKIDSTTGTPSVIDIVSGSGSSNPYNLINANGVLYFVASGNSNGYELWKVDATTGSPIFLKDIYAGSSSSSPGNLTYSNGKLYFTADNGTQGVELWAVNVDVITTIGNITKNSNEDQTVSFTATDFSSVFVSGSGSPLTKVKILLLPSNGVLKLGSDAVTANQEISVANLGSLTFVPNANFNGTVGFTWNGSDGTTFATDSSTVTLTINSINDLPSVANPIADISIYSDRSSNFGFSANTFQDADLGDTLSYSATLADGSPLPSWLSLSGDRTFSSNPSSANAGQYEIKVTAKDQSNATVTDNFILNVLNSAPTNIYLSNNTIPENSADNTLIATLSSEDYNTNNTHSYTLINDAGGRFKLNGNQLVVANTSLLDYEAATQHTIRVKTTDNTSLTYERDFVIYLGNVNDSFAGTLSFTAPTFSVNENGNAVAAVTIQRTGGSEGTVSANISLSNGTATYPSDYSTTSVNVLFANGETSKTVTIPIFDDNLFEGDETLNLTLLDPTGGANLGTQTTAVLTIVDNENVPDLIVSDITAPVEVISGQQFEISWTVKNQGVTAATGTWKDYVYLQNQNGGQDYNIGTFEFVGSLGVGESVNRSQSITLPIQLQGNYKVVVTTDSSNSIREGAQNESNNTTTDDRLLQVKLAPIPNLQVSSVIAPLTAFSSQSTAIQWTVKNVGNGATSSPYWSDAVYLSLDNTFDNTDIYLGQANNPSYLNAGDSYTNHLDVTLPRGISGNYYFLVKTDVSNNVFENDKENDNLTVGGPTNVSLTPPPDFQITNVTTPSQSFSGQSLNLSWTVTNKGIGKNLETVWYDQVFMSADEVLDANDRNLGTFSQNGILNSNDSYTSSQTVSLPIGISGDYYFFVRTDAGNQVFESVFDGNNTGYKATPTRINLTPPPDLEILALTLPTQATASRALNFSYQVTNFGSTTTPNYYWTDRFYLSLDNKLDTNTDLFIGDQPHYGSLAPDESYTSNFSYTLPNTLTGNYYLFGITDSNNEVFELNNENNTFLATTPLVITSQPADLVVVSASVPMTGEAGKALRVEWTVRNQGTGDTAVSSWTDRVILSKDAQIGNGDDIVLGSFSRGEILAPNQSYTRSELVTLPIDAIAGYQVFVVTDAGNSVYEATQENNNSSTGQPLTVTRESADLQVTQVSSPSSGQSGQALTVDWTVKNFGSRTNRNYWYDGVYLSTDNQISNDDIFLGNAYRSEALDASGQYSVSRSFNLPNNLQARNYYTLVRADVSNYVYEGALENNNDKATEGTTAGTGGVTTGGTSVGVTASPDLVMVSVDEPTTGISGQNLTVNWTVRNAGTVETGDRSWYEAFYLSRDQVFDRNSDIYLGYHSYTGNLAAGATYSQTESFRLPQGISGSFYLFAKTDAGNSLYEGTVENNNVAYDPTSVVVSLAQPADLVVGTITIPANGVTGQSASITYTVTNEGSNAVVGNWSDSLYLSKDGQWDINDLFLGQVNNSGEVLSGNSYTNTLTAPLPGVVPGDYQVIIRSDIRNQIPESNESNNLKATLDKVNLDVERLILGTPSTGSLAQGQGVYYRFDVGAGETLRVNLDSASTTAANELYIRYGEVPTRSQFDVGFSQPLSPDQDVVVPFTKAGTYYILAYNSSLPNEADQYTIDAKILPFGIESLSVNTIGNQGTATVGIKGGKLTPTTQFVLTDSSGQDVSLADKLTDKILLNPSLAYATFQTDNLSPGNYSIKAIDGNIVSDSIPLQVINGNGQLLVNVNAPANARRDQNIELTINYRNVGSSDLLPPVILVKSKSGNNLTIAGATGEYSNSTLALLAVSSDGPSGILRPDSYGQIKLKTVAITTLADIDISVVNPSNEPFDWDLFAGSTESANDPKWKATVSLLENRLGTTWKEVVKGLSESATRAGLGTSAVGLNELLAWEMYLAENNTPVAEQTANVAQFSSVILGNQSYDRVPIFDPSGGFKPATDVTVTPYGNFDASRPTTVIVHGWNNNKDAAWMSDLAGTIDNHDPNRNIVIAGWGPGADRFFPNDAAYNINATGIEVANKLRDLGLSGSGLDFVCHSFGTYVCNVAAKELGGANSLVALDPASRLGFNPTNLPDTDFSKNFQYSAAYHSGDIAGTYHTNANEDFYIDTPYRWWNAGKEHSYAIDFYRDQIEKNGPFGLSRTQPQVEQRNGFDGFIDPNGNLSPGSPFNPFDPRHQFWKDLENWWNETEEKSPTLFNDFWDKFNPLIPTIISLDPNDIIGPTGFGEEKWTSATSTLPYTIRFENQSTATAPAQTVTVTHPLDTDLDLRTFRLSSFGWGGLIFDVPANTAFYNQRLDLTATRGYFVDVTAGIDLVKGEAFWTVTTIDPNTGDITTDALTGFLPPNNADGIGDGFVNYTIRAKRDVTTGTVIDAKATIVFDTEAPIDTPPIFNTLDAGKPTSSVKALPTIVPDTEFLVNWTGNDDANGSALATYTIYVSDNGGEFTPWLDKTTLTEATYVGKIGHTYAFYSVATDNSGLTEAVPNQADTITSVGSIVDVNHPPTVLQSIADQSTIEDTTFSFTIPANTFTDIDAGDVLTYSATLENGNALPTWLTFNSTTRTFSGTPTNDNVGSLNVKVTTTDKAGANVSDIFAIAVENLNDVPTLVNAIADQTAKQGTAFNFQIPNNTFTDIDTSDVLTYSVTLENGNALPTWLSFNATTRTFSGTPTNDNVGSLNVKVTATDKEGANVSDIFAIAVENLNDAPIVSNAIADQTTKQGDAFNFQIPSNTFTDIDAGDVLTYSATLENGNALPTWLSFNATTRTFSGTPTNDNVGSLNVKATATDKAGVTVSDIFAIAIEDLNDAPIVSNAITDQTAKQGDSFNFQIPTNTFTDIDTSDVLTYSATLENGNALPSWLSFNATTRTFSGTPASTDIGTLNVKVIASDLANSTASDRFTITIANTVTGNNGLISGTGAGDDVLIASSNSAFNGESNILFTGAGSDRIDFRPISTNPNSGNNRIDAGSGDDTIFVSKGDRVFGGDGNDTFEAKDGKGGNRMSGGAGDDKFFLGFGDRALGGDGNDQFFVSSGGNNLLSGGAGADIFNIITAGTNPSASNTILDFQAGTDLIGVQGKTFADLTFTGNNIAIGSSVIATLTGVETSSLTASNFKFA